MRNRNKRKFRAWKPVIILIAIATLLLVYGYQTKMTRINTVRADEMESFSQRQTNKIALLEDTNDKIAKELKVATAKPQSQKLTDQEAREMIADNLPAEYKDDFYKLTAHCENGTLVTDKVHTNVDGTKDYGMSQINDKYHRARVERMFGLPFEVAMSIPVLNYYYAGWLVRHDQNFHQWACAKKVGVKS